MQQMVWAACWGQSEIGMKKGSLSCLSGMNPGWKINVDDVFSVS